MDEAAALLRLSEKDLELARVRKQLDELPEKKSILELRHRAKEIEALRLRAQSYVDEAARMVKRHEDEVADVQSKIDAEQLKITEGKGLGPKEIHDLSRELDALKRRKDKLEMTTMEVMQKLEDGKRKAAQVDEALVKAGEKERALIARYQEKGAELQAGIARLSAERAELVKLVDPALLDRYDEACRAKHGIGVGVLRDGMCSICRVELPSGTLQALLAGPAIGTCPNCRRLLVTREVEA